MNLSGGFENNSLNIKLPTLADWLKIGTEEAEEIRVRTESRGLDVENKDFKPYSQAYAEYKASTGRPIRPNLSFTTRMLGSLGSGITPARDQVSITLSGEEGEKAYKNQQRGRVFMGVPPDRLEKLANVFADLIIKDI